MRWIANVRHTLWALALGLWPSVLDVRDCGVDCCEDLPVKDVRRDRWKVESDLKNLLEVVASGDALISERRLDAHTIKATIHPGVRTFTSGTQCRAGFVFYDARAVYLSQAPWCSDALPLGTPVKIEGASRPGKLVYNSWLTMERVGEAIRGNDFALVRIDNVDRGRVNPSVPFWGGPVGDGGRSSLGKRVYTYGNSEVYCWEDDCPRGSSPAGVNTLSPRFGIDITTARVWGPHVHDGWTHNIYTVAPGVSGDQGSAVLDEHGRALGILGYPWHDTTDQVTDLPKAMAYMKAKTSLDAIQLAKGTEPFLPPL